MKLELKRKWLTSTSTLGELYVDGTRECYTLENAVRGHKIDGCTAIPAGTYRVTLELWPSRAATYPFGPSTPPLYPLLHNVPDFSGIFIHCGNYPSTPEKHGDSEGCILIGKIKGTDMISQSRAAFKELLPKLKGQKDITITIS